MVPAEETKQAATAESPTTASEAAEEPKWTDNPFEEEQAPKQAATPAVPEKPLPYEEEPKQPMPLWQKAAIGLVALGVVMVIVNKMSSCYDSAGESDGPVAFYKRTLGITADGTRYSLSDFEGQYVWVDYSAAWCKPCRAQAEMISSLARELGDSVVFPTVLTSGERGPVTRNSAHRWADTYDLNLNRVLSQEGKTTMVSNALPEHALIGPEGRELYRRSGYHNGWDIKDVIARFQGD